MRSTVRGTCHHDCPDSCGWEVTVEDTAEGPVAVRMGGNPDHPFSQGSLCPKVVPFLDRVYSPQRVLEPLRRAGRKGEGRFQKVTWNEALEEIGHRFKAIIAEHGGEAILPYTSAGNQSLLAAGFGQRLWHHLGATRITGGLCGVVAAVGTAATNGTGKGIDASDLRHSGLIILWATNTRLTNRHLWPFIEEARQGGAQVVAIDPIRTITAESADWFLQPYPGTDVAVMLGMMHELIRQGLIDHEWVDAHTVGYEELSSHVSGWTPELAGEISGLAAGDIIDFESLERPDLLAGRTPRAFDAPLLGRALTDPSVTPQVKGLVLIGVNPLVSVPDAGKVRAGLARDDVFTIVHEQFLTDTARFADIVLPATTQIESVDVVQPWGHMYLGWNEPAIPPIGEAVSNSELHRRLAAALECTEPALFDDDYKAIAD